MDLGLPVLIEKPFTINAAQTLCFVNVNDLLGFEVGDLKTGKMLHRVEVTGYAVADSEEQEHRTVF